jgi:hypothetical protein
MTDAELLETLDKMRATMIAVATGGPRIPQVNGQFQQQCREVTEELASRGIEHKLPFGDLWEWYGRWSEDDLPTYASRRAYVAQLFEPITSSVRQIHHTQTEPTGWALVDRQMQEARNRLLQAKSEEQFQAVGLMCREALISLAQEVFDPSKHPTEPGVKVSATDYKRMIEAYIAITFAGGSAEEVRRHARSALDLALRLQHQRTANFRDAAICVEATRSVVSIIAIASGRRDPL